MSRRNRSKTHAVLSSPITMVAAAILLAALARAAIGIHERAAESADRLAQAQMSLAKMTANEAQLQDQIKELSTDAGIETSIREKYHAVAPGESVAVVVDPGDAMTGDQPATTTEQAAPWWERAFRAMGL